MTDVESQAADHGQLPLAQHVDTYVRHLKAKGCAPRRIDGVKRRLMRVVMDCRLSRLGKLDAAALERWLVEQQELGMSASTRNTCSGRRPRW